MIVFADPSTQTVMIAGKTIEEFDFSEIKEIAKRIKGKQVIWVTGAAKAGGDEVLELLGGFIEQFEQQSRNKPRTGRMLMHSTVSGQVVITGPNNVVIKFSNPLDFKDVSAFPEDIFERMPNLKKAINQGKIAIIDEADKSLVRAKYGKFLKKQEKREKDRDRQLDSILVDSGVSAIDHASRGGSDADAMDLTNEQEMDSVDDDSEESKFIKKYDIK